MVRPTITSAARAPERMIASDGLRGGYGTVTGRSHNGFC
jgi:hypothetical protein